MGWQIIKQPNGKFCIFSSIVDNVIYYDGTPDQIINTFIDAESSSIRKKVNGIIDQIEKGEKPYYQFTKTFDQMIETIKNIHGNKEAEKVINKLK